MLKSLLLALGVGLELGDAAQRPHKHPPKSSSVSDGDAARWNMALNNARNVQQELGADQVQVEIVAYGPGIEHAQGRAP